MTAPPSAIKYTKKVRYTVFHHLSPLHSHTEVTDPYLHMLTTRKQWQGGGEVTDWISKYNFPLELISTRPRGCFIKEI